MDEEVIVFQGEMQLLSWRETNSNGATVTFALSDPSQLDCFRDITSKKGNIAGQRLMVAMVEIGDDEQPVAQRAKEVQVAKEIPEKPKGGELAKLAGMWCNNVQFRKWIGASTPEEAREVICQQCKVNSRAELDSSPQASQRFHNLFRVPFSNKRTFRRS